MLIAGRMHNAFGTSPRLPRLGQLLALRPVPGAPSEVMSKSKSPAATTRAGWAIRRRSPARRAPSRRQRAPVRRRRFTPAAVWGTPLGAEMDRRHPMAERARGVQALGLRQRDRPRPIVLAGFRRDTLRIAR